MKFSVVMSVYKNDIPEQFSRSLESITELQTIKPNEIVLVVDGPISDCLNMVIAEYIKKNDNFKVIRLKNNGGLGNALRLAVEASTNELIARMDSDDISLPARFEEQLAFFENNPNVDMVGGNITEFIENESNIVAGRNVPCTNEEIVKYMEKRCAFNHVSVMFKKDAVQKAGGYLDCFWNEDYYLWLRMMLSGCIFTNTGTVLVNVRVGTDMYNRRGGVKYFKSELFLQNFMFKNKIIGIHVYLNNVFKRFIVQILLPNKIRGWAFKNFARNK